MKRLLPGLLLLAATPLLAAEMKATVVGDTVQITTEGKPVVTYQMSPGPVPQGVPESFAHGAHLHPVWSPEGKIVTGNHPPDHRWHRGVWMAWTHTEFQGRTPDFWNMGKDKEGNLTGEVRFMKLLKSWSGETAGFISQHRFIDHTGGAEVPVLDETWEVTVRARSGDHPVNLIDLVSTQTVIGKEALKLPTYHYGGLGVRGNPAWDPADAVRMLTSEGDDRKAGDGKTARWVQIGGDVDGAPASMTILIHPENFRFPQPLRLNPKNPQLCIAPSAAGDWSIEPGRPYISRYRLVVMDGMTDAAVLEALWKEYATGR